MSTGKIGVPNTISVPKWVPDDKMFVIKPNPVPTLKTTGAKELPTLNQFSKRAKK